MVIGGAVSLGVEFGKLNQAIEALGALQQRERTAAMKAPIRKPICSPFPSRPTW
jgi:hypothetical protein